METYREFIERQQAEFNLFPLGAAFNDKQFAEMMSKWGLTENDTDKILNIGAGCFIRKADREAFKELCDRHAREREEAMKADTDGTGFIFEMFCYELANYECGYTGDVTPALEACGLTLEEVKGDPVMKEALNCALKDYIGSFKEW